MSTRLDRRSFAGLTPAAWILSSAAFLTLASCGGTIPGCALQGCGPILPAVSVTPGHATLPRGGSRQLSAAVENLDDKRVAWSVREGAAGGTVSQTGVYTAPSTPGVYHVVAMAANGITASARVAVIANFRTYTVVDLGDFLPIAINSRGVMAGTVSVNGNPRAAVYDNGVVRNLGDFTPADINDSAVVGSAGVGNEVHTMLHDGTTLRDLGTFTGDWSTTPRRINNSGQIVADSYTPSGLIRAAVYSGGSWSIISPSGSGNTNGRDISDSGSIVGFISDGTVHHAFIHSGGVTTLLGEPAGFASTRAQAINSSGQIAGFMTKPGSEETHLFLRTGSQYSDLGGEPGIFSHSLVFGEDTCHLNSAGHIAGHAAGIGPYLYNGEVVHQISLPAGTSGSLYISGLAEDGRLIGNIENGGFRRGCILVPQ